MSTTARPIPDHGTASRYRGDPRNNRWAPCHCKDCCAGARRNRKTVELRIARGGTARHDVAPVVAHIRSLEAAGWSRNEIARAAGVNRKTLYNALAGNFASLDHSTAVKVLRLKAEDGGTRVDPTGAMRRLQALAAIGWSVSLSAQQSGISDTTCLTLSRGEMQWISPVTHKAIAAVYRRNARRPGPSGWVRAHAAKRGWVGPLAWDDIDDPNAQPDTARRRRTRDDLRGAAYQRAEAEHLYGLGESIHQIARSLNCGTDYVNQLLGWPDAKAA